MIPKAMAKALKIVLTAYAEAFWMLFATRLCIVWYAETPGTKGMMPGMQNTVAGDFKRLAISSLYKPTATVPVKICATLSESEKGLTARAMQYPNAPHRPAQWSSLFSIFNTIAGATLPAKARMNDFRKSVVIQVLL